MPTACRLCCRVRPLRDSHIIPEFLYRPAYDDKHRAAELTANPPKRRYLQKGLREPLLCAQCEQVIGRYERYFAQKWYEEKILPSQIPDEIIAIKGLEYRRFKLFHQSILWRAGVSSLDVFSNVTLGRRHEQRLRGQLLQGDSGPDDRYSFFALALVDEQDKVVHAAIMEPLPSRYDGHHVYVFLFGGCAWYYFVSSHTTRPYLDWHFSSTGPFYLAKTDFYSSELVRDFAARYGSARRASQ